MIFRWHFSRRIPVVMLQIFMFACSGPVRDLPTEDLQVAWPKPPLQPRISFLYEIRNPKDANIGTGFLARVSSALKGNQAQDIARPYGMATSSDGELFIIDNGYQAVHVFDIDNRKYSLFPERRPDDFINPVNIALGSNGAIYVSDSASGVLHVFNNRGQAYKGSIGGGVLQRPTGIAVNKTTSELLVLDTKASTLVVFDEPTLRLKRIIGNSKDKDMQGATFHYPTNIATTLSGDVYVADSLNFRIQILNSALERIGEFGAAGTSPGEFSRPKGIATDSDGHIYVVDAIFDNVQVFKPNGELLIAFGGPGHGAGKFWLPNAICIDDRDRIYVSDAYNQRIQVFQYHGDRE